MTSAAIREAIDEIATAWDVPGGVVAISDRSGLVFEYAFGFADIARGTTATADHLFEIGSISKIMTATVVLNLVEQGLLGFDQSASSILDGLPPVLQDPSITVERMLRHSAGLVSGVDAVPDQWAQVGGFSGVLSSAKPGEFFHYSNLGFILLGLMVERVSGRSLARLVQEIILEPIGARDSVSRVTFDHRARLAQGYQPLHEDRPWLPGDELAAAPFLEVDGADGSVATTGRDLATFARMLLNGGVADGGRAVLSPSSFDTMTSRLAVDGEELLGLHAVPSSSESRYGLGINIERRGGSSILTHGGGMVGYASFLLVDPEADLAVVVLTNANGDGPIAEAIARTVAAAYAGAEHGPSDPLSPELWCEPTAGDGSEAARPRLLTESMVGTFAGNAGQLEVRSKSGGGGRVTAEVRLNGESAPLLWDWGPRAFTRLPALQPYPLEFDGRNWCWGPDIFRPSVADESHAQATDDPEGLTAFCGHFRTYSPWFTNFRTVVRAGELVLIATPGVEAPGEDIRLVPLGGGVFRMGADPRLPERLTFGPPINGLSQWVDRDGCRYSRSFTA